VRKDSYGRGGDRDEREEKKYLKPVEGTYKGRLEGRRRDCRACGWKEVRV
jgi:hypothetical protein